MVHLKTLKNIFSCKSVVKLKLIKISVGIFQQSLYLLFDFESVVRIKSKHKYGSIVEKKVTIKSKYLLTAVLFTNITWYTVKIYI